MSKSLEEMEALILAKKVKEDPPEVEIKPLFQVKPVKPTYEPHEAEEVVASWSERILSWFQS